MVPKPVASAANLDSTAGLDAIRDSSFISGSTIGTIVATAKVANSSTTDNAGSIAALHASAANLVFTAPGGIGAITASASGAPDDNVAGRSEAPYRVSFSATNGAIGASHFSANLGSALNSQAHAVTGVDMNASGMIGAMKFDGKATVSQVSDLQVSAGSLAGVTVAATTKALGSLVDSNLFVAQSLTLDGATVSDQAAQLAQAALGKVSLSGNLTDSQLVSGGVVGAITVGGDMTDSVVVAGTNLGGDRYINGNEVYIRQGAIASVQVTGAFLRSSIAAGVSAGADGSFGTSDDVAPLNAGLLTQAGGIGSLIFGAATTTASLPLKSSDGQPHNYAIEAATLASVKIGAFEANTDFSLPLYIDAANNNEDSGDVLVRQL